jgi:2Fe-2S ferredoxin
MSQEITLHFKTSDDTLHTVDAVVGESVMETAIKNDIDDVIAECGGSRICSTCHVYVDDATVAILPEADDAELDMLEGVAAERKTNSRLSCQLIVTAEMDGHTILTPDRQ